MHRLHSELAPVVILSAVFATVVQSSVIRRSTIENPCQTDLTYRGNGTFLPLPNQINATISASRTAKEMCETVRTTLVQGNYLTADEIATLDRRPCNITGLSGEYTNTNMNQANVFTRFLRHSALNITVIYNKLQRVVVSRRLPAFDSMLRNLTSSIIALKCTVTRTSEVRESTFTAQEMIVEEEMLLVDYHLYVSAEEARGSDPLPQDMKGTVGLVYSLARCMQAYTGVLKNALQVLRQ